MFVVIWRFGVLSTLLCFMSFVGFHIQYLHFLLLSWLFRLCSFGRIYVFLVSPYVGIFYCNMDSVQDDIAAFVFLFYSIISPISPFQNYIGSGRPQFVCNPPSFPAIRRNPLLKPHRPASYFSIILPLSSLCHFSKALVSR